jgi:hypothetical protein
MSKKRKTRQEKIILQLKRQLARQVLQGQSQAAPAAPLGTKFKTRQEAIFEPEPKDISKKEELKKPYKSVFFYDPSLIKKDLLKSLIFTLIVISLEIVLYLRLR